MREVIQLERIQILASACPCLHHTVLLSLDRGGRSQEGSSGNRTSMCKGVAGKMPDDRGAGSGGAEMRNERCGCWTGA